MVTRKRNLLLSGTVTSLLIIKDRNIESPHPCPCSGVHVHVRCPCSGEKCNDSTHRYLSLTHATAWNLRPIHAYPYQNQQQHRFPTRKTALPICRTAARRHVCFVLTLPPNSERENYTNGWKNIKRWWEKAEKWERKNKRE